MKLVKYPQNIIDSIILFAYTNYKFLSLIRGLN